jgi:XTP/dITP diphosphohydrolase
VDVPHAHIVLASGNPGKLAEIRTLLEGLAVCVLPQSELAIEAPPETGATFAENALIKARHAAGMAGLPAIADDSGLVVDALRGRPGIRSARYAGSGATDDRNIDRLLAELGDLPDEARSAAFHCVAVHVTGADDPAPLVAEGVWRGRIARERRGSGGFGYDPVFYDPALGRTAAELDAAEKNRASHRGQAFRQLRELLVRRATP